MQCVAIVLRSLVRGYIHYDCFDKLFSHLLVHVEMSCKIAGLMGSRSASIATTLPAGN
jgi:hypothetical protein